ncbi:MAG TPA: murein L,D-transpeptidase catalytic domain family protein [Sphingobacterium sp.]|nr:murein L,D-transpeptidase catalytic domain family protein [Sphingobacterium sp.]
MRKILFVFALISVVGLCAFLVKPIQSQEKPQVSSLQIDTLIAADSSVAERLYHQLDLDEKLKYEIFEMAFLGYEQLPVRNRDIITIIDFTLPSTEKRMYVIDLKNKKLLFHTIVSHGRNSGQKYATSFSNRHGSYQSSLGFYVTENTYQGGNGYSLVLNGLERGINDQAKARAVVIHGADYCSQKIINATGRLGRSYGCPALPRELNKPIIDAIKGGSMLFIYADNVDYLASSHVLKAQEGTRLAQRELSDVELPGKAILN